MTQKNLQRDVSSRWKLPASWVFCNEFVFGENGRVWQESSLCKCMCQLKCYQRSVFSGMVDSLGYDLIRFDIIWKAMSHEESSYAKTMDSESVSKGHSSNISPSLEGKLRNIVFSHFSVVRVWVWNLWRCFGWWGDFIYGHGQNTAKGCYHVYLFWVCLTSK